MVKQILISIIDGVASTAVSVVNGVEGILDNIPVIGEPLADKVLDPVTDIIGKILIMPAKMLGLTKKYR